MDFKQIQELIKMINKSNIGEVTIEEKGFKVTIKQKEEPVAASDHCTNADAVVCSHGCNPSAAQLSRLLAAAADKPKGCGSAA